MPNARKILIVDDDPEMRDALTNNCRCTRSSRRRGTRIGGHLKMVFSIIDRQQER
jgi:hypothetical protein